MREKLLHKIGTIALAAVIAMQSAAIVKVETAYAAYNREDTEIFSFYKDENVVWGSDGYTLEQYQNQFNEIYARQKHNIDTTGRMSNVFTAGSRTNGGTWSDWRNYGVGERTSTGWELKSDNKDTTKDYAYAARIRPKGFAIDEVPSGTAYNSRKYYGVSTSVNWGTMETPWTSTPDALPKKIACTTYYDFSAYTDMGYFVFEFCLPTAAANLFDDMFFIVNDAKNVQNDHIVSETNGTGNGGQTDRKTNSIGRRLSQYVDFDEATDANKWIKVEIPMSDFLEAPSADDPDNWWNCYENGSRRGIDFTKLMSVNLVWVVDSEKDYSGYTNDWTYIAIDNVRMVYIDAPSGVECTDTTADTATISWYAPSTPVYGYEVFRKAPGETEFTSVAKINDANTLTYTDTGLEVNKTYEYKVRSIDDLNGVSKLSAAVTAQTSSVGRPKDFDFALPGEGEETGIILSWATPSYGNYTKYYIYRKTKDAEGQDVPGNDYVLIATLDAKDSDNADVLTYTDRNDISLFLFYDYYIVSEDADGVVSPKTNITNVFASVIAPPTNLTADAKTDRTVELKWNGPKNAAYYVVYRNGKKVSGNLTDREFTDGLMDDILYETYYTYTVRAFTSADERSDDSAGRTIFIQNPEKTTYLTLFDDMRNSDYSMSGGKYGGAYEVDSENYISGRKSLKVSFNENTSLPQCVFFKPANTFDVKSLREAGALIGFSIYAENEDAIRGVGFGFTNSAKVWVGADTKDAKRTAFLPLSDYVKDFGNWVYVEIPLEDFPEWGEIVGETLEEPKGSFDYSKVEEMGFYAKTPGQVVKPCFNVDDLAFHKYKSPAVESVMTIGGALISGTSTQTIPGDTEILKIKFTYDMDKDTLNPNTVTIKNSSGVNVPLYCEYSEADRTCTVRLLESFAVNSGYTLSVSGAKSSHGVAASVYSKGFATDSTQSTGTVTLPDQKVYIENGTSASGAASSVRVYLGSDTQTSNNVVAVDMTIEYNSSIVSLKNGASDAVLDAQLTGLGASAAVLSTNKLGIKSEIKADSELKPSGTLCTLTFSPVANGSASLTVTGTFTVKEPVTGIMRNMNIAGNTATIAVSGYGASYVGGGSGGGSSSSGIGGGRPTTSVIPTPPTPSGSEPTGIDAIIDLNDAEWATESIKYLFEKGIISGYEDKTVKPNNLVTREEFVTMLVNALGIEDEEAVSDFLDADKNAWYYKYLSSAFAKGIISGVDAENFGVGTYITREQMCAILYRAIEQCALNTKQKLSDNEFADEAQISEYAKDAVKYLYMLQIVSGMGENTFAPNENVTRAMACRVIYGLLKNVEEANFSITDGGYGSSNNE